MLQEDRQAVYDLIVSEAMAASAAFINKKRLHYPHFLFQAFLSHVFPAVSAMESSDDRIRGVASRWARMAASSRRPVIQP
jgi:predicted nucleic acid-binding protein